MIGLTVASAVKLWVQTKEEPHMYFVMDIVNRKRNEKVRRRFGAKKTGES